MIIYNGMKYVDALNLMYKLIIRLGVSPILEAEKGGRYSVVYKVVTL